MIQVLRIGSCLINDSKRPVLNTSQYANRCATNNGAGDVFPTKPICAECNQNCMAEYRGNLIIAIGLNDALKSHQIKYRQHQDVKELIKNLNQTLLELIPHAKNTYFIRPIEVAIWGDADDGSPVNYQVYDDLLDTVRLYNYSCLSPFNRTAVKFDD